MLKMSKGQSLYGANMRCKVNFKILMPKNEQLTENKGKTDITDE